ncbi:hypothetical protein RJ639_015214 [Escallonia herrerae]|uniref:Remorin C-terminal domain-containing protein n=1 Tax=Escallonia herrerae TaxID=1293975 RepID=A0AA88VJE4_9ASTE|nr:hypothetical protein RJ639_015214 [Escallonia herrerae]
MEYERIHKAQTGMISPSKLRMKLMGPHNQKKKEGSNNNSSRTSPSKLEDSEFVKNSLLDTGDFDEEVSSVEDPPVLLSSNAVLNAGHADQNSCQPKELMARDHVNGGRVKMQQYSKADSGNSSSVHPMRTFEDDNLDYDSNASSSSFEFHKGERSLHNPVARSLLRHKSSKWNDAEKWIINRQNVQSNFSKKNNVPSQASRIPVMNGVRVVPDAASYDNKSLVKRVDFCHPALQMGLEKFSFTHPGPHPNSTNCESVSIDASLQVKDLEAVNDSDLSCTRSSSEEPTGVPAIRSVSMRDMGTEMTPIPSQEPSRTATPVGATTPLRSPTSSIPSTPRRGAPTSTPTDESENPTGSGKGELSEQELKLKTRKEILVLGVQLGKMNIAAWASKDEKEKNTSADKLDMEELQRIEFEKRAAAWEEAEKCKHNARFKREEIQIQSWESQQKAKLDAEMTRIEAQVEQMRAHAQAKMVKKIAMARQRSEEKRAAAEARKKRQAEVTTAQAEYIRQTGRMPSSSFICCGW